VFKKNKPLHIRQLQSVESLTIYLIFMLLLCDLSQSEIISRLKQYFTDEEIDEVSAKLDLLAKECETLEDLVDEIDDYLAGDEGELSI
jgi:hypothetical protein